MNVGMDDNQFFDKSNEPEKSSKWYHGILVVLTGLFLLGPLAFPLLWKSPNFNFFWKLVITALVAVSTMYMLGKTLDIVNLVISDFKKAGLM